MKSVECAHFVDPLGEFGLPATWDEVAAILDGLDSPLDDATARRLPGDWNFLPGSGETCRPHLVVKIDATTDLDQIMDDVDHAIGKCRHSLVIFHCNMRYLPFMERYSRRWLRKWRHRSGTRFAVRVSSNWLSRISGIERGGLPQGYPWGKEPHRVSRTGLDRLRLRVWQIDDLCRQFEIGCRFVQLHTGQPPVGDGPNYAGPTISFGERVTAKKVHEWLARIALDPEEEMNVMFPARLKSVRCVSSSIAWGAAASNPDNRPWRPLSWSRFLLDPAAYVQT